MSQGKQQMKKLIIGATTFNILVTCTIPLSPGDVDFVSCGLTCHNVLHNIDLSYAHILLQKNAASVFETTQISQPKDIADCRQLILAFNREPTY
ncbi:unnamed protein product [Mucor hiemalis]